MDLHLLLITLGCLWVVGLIADEIGHRTWLPRVTLIILLGIFAGPLFLDLMSDSIVGLYDPLATIALTMVAFLLGGTLSRSELSRHGSKILLISLSVVVVTVLMVFGGLLLLGTPIELALIFAAIATATAPAAIQDVIRQTGSSGDFTKTLLGIVAIDDAWGLIIFSVILVAVNALLGNGYETVLIQGARELFGAIAIGAIIGLPAAYITGRLRPGEPIQAEALAIVFLCAGISLWLDVSFLISGIVAGMIISNLAKHHTRPFHEIENIEWPFMVLFFFLAGASLQSGFSPHFLALVSGFILLRMVSRIAGGWIGSTVSDSPPVYRHWMGVALWPQAGVAIGMALIAAGKFPDMADIIVGVAVGATVIFEIIGPIGTLVALRKAGEISNKDDI